MDRHDEPEARSWTLGSATLPDGRTIGYRVAGEGAALVCHPGGPGFSGGYFVDLLPLSRSRTVVVLDPRGTGRSDAPADGRYQLEDYADDVDAVRTHLGVERIDLLGHSHGGFVAMTFAARHPASLRHLLLVCTAARFSAPLRAEIAGVIESRRHEPWHGDATSATAERRARSYASVDDYAELWRRELRLHTTSEVDYRRLLTLIASDGPHPGPNEFFNDHIAAHYDQRPILPSIVAPTTVINAERDFLGPVESARELASLITECNLTILPGLGHFPFIEDPTTFCATVERSLAPVSA